MEPTPDALARLRERDALLDEAQRRCVIAALKQAQTSAWSPDAPWIRAFKAWAQDHGVDDPSGAALWADLHVATILYAVNQFAHMADALAAAQEREHDFGALVKAMEPFVRLHAETTSDLENMAAASAVLMRVEAYRDLLADAPMCSQCGEPFTAPACGPTHAAIADALLADAPGEWPLRQPLAQPQVIKKGHDPGKGTP